MNSVAYLQGSFSQKAPKPPIQGSLFKIESIIPSSLKVVSLIGGAIILIGGAIYFIHRKFYSTQQRHVDLFYSPLELVPLPYGSIAWFLNANSNERMEFLKKLLPQSTLQDIPGIALFPNGQEHDSCLCCYNEKIQVVYLPCGHGIACCECDIGFHCMRLNCIFKENGFDPNDMIDITLIKDLMLQEERKKRLIIFCPYCKTDVQQRILLP